ncbi:Espin-like [Oopsacas minuta]|uniref:Espin-like n=1 Tax=Oopsacas minuta TaxID=111878 RepID=A0AAV7K0R3_9METZ|nr:Espin-like [Oopsacas minuta]
MDRIKKVSILRKDSAPPLPEPRPLKDFPRLAKNPFPLHAAAYSGNLSVLMHILGEDNFLDKYPPFDPHGASVIHLAAQSNSVETLRWLLAQKDYERVSGVYWLSALAVGSGGDTPAHVAAVRGNLESFQALWESTEEKILLMKPDTNGFSPLHLAASKGHDKIVSWLIKQLKPDASDFFKSGTITASHIAAIRGYVSVIAAITKHYKHHSNLRDQSGCTPVYFSAQEGHYDCVKLMLEESKADPTIASADGMTSLHAAAQGGSTEVLRYLTKKCGQEALTVPSYNGSTVLHFASSGGHEETVKYILGADKSAKLLHTRDVESGTPAHDAAENGHVNVLRMLVAAGADINAVDKTKVSPYQLATRDRENPCFDFATQEKQRIEAIHFQDIVETTTERVVVAEGNKIDIKSRNKRKSAGDYYEAIVRKPKKDSVRDKRKSARMTIMAESELTSEKTESLPKAVRIRPLSVPTGVAPTKDELSNVFDKIRGKKRDITAPQFRSESERHGLEGAGNELKDVLSNRTKKAEVRGDTEPIPEQ